MKTLLRMVSFAAAAAALGITACHVGGGYTVGGTVTGLRGSNLVLQNNSGDNLTLGASGSFVFTSAIDQGGAYSITVKTQPSNPAQTCVVHNDSGTIGTADIDECRRDLHSGGALCLCRQSGLQHLSAFSIDAATGALRPIAGSPFASTGTTPVAAVVDPNGTVLCTSRITTPMTYRCFDRRCHRRSHLGRAAIAAGNGPFAVLVDPADRFPLRRQHDGQYGLGVRDSTSGGPGDANQRFAVRGWTSADLDDDRSRRELSLRD